MGSPTGFRRNPPKHFSCSSSFGGARHSHPSLWFSAKADKIDDFKLCLISSSREELIKHNLKSSILSAFAENHRDGCEWRALPKLEEQEKGFGGFRRNPGGR